MERISFSALAAHLGQGKRSEMPITDFQVDSRKVSQKSLFFALKGQKRDGHEFLKEVAEKGAFGAVVSKDYKGENFGLVLFPVEDVLEALQGLAKQSLIQRSVKVVAVTGSLGKTMTKGFIATLLEGKYRVGKSPANYNSQIGLALSILNSEGNEEILVLEMGMTKKGELRRLVDIAPPEIALITKVSLVHAENFPEGLKGIAEAKAEIFSQEKTKVAFFPQSFLQFSTLLQESKATKISFSIEDPTADFFLFADNENLHIDEKGVRAIDFPLPFWESHLLEDYIAAIAIARTLKMSWEEILRQTRKLCLPSMRFEKKEMGGVLFINDSYNASPESMKMALFNLPPPKAGGKKIAVLGEMKELGTFSLAAHEEVAKHALEKVDHLLCLGKGCLSMCFLFQEGKKPAELFENHEALTKRLCTLMAPGDVVLVKGSRSCEMERIFELMG